MMNPLLPLLRAPVFLGDAHYTFAAPDRVQPTEFAGARLEGAVLRVALPAKALVALTLE